MAAGGCCFAICKCGFDAVSRNVGASDCRRSAFGISRWGHFGQFGHLGPG